MTSAMDRFWDQGSNVSRSWRPVMMYWCSGWGSVSVINKKTQWAAVTTQCLFRTLAQHLWPAPLGSHSVVPFSTEHPSCQTSAMKGYLWGGSTSLPFIILSFPKTREVIVTKVSNMGVCRIKDRSKIILESAEPSCMCIMGVWWLKICVCARAILPDRTLWNEGNWYFHFSRWCRLCQ